MSREITLNGVTVNEDSECYVIAEIGNNHQGSVDIAIQMLDMANAQGASACKFQKRDNRALLTEAMYNSPYDNVNSFGKTYGEHRDNLELDYQQFKDIKAYADEIGMTIFATPFDLPSVEVLEKLGMPFYKMASGDLTNSPLQEEIARTGKPMIISTGGFGLEDVKRAVDNVLSHNDQLAVLQCTSGYPVLDYKDFNLRVIETYRDMFPNTVIGLSDHENGTSMTLIAYMLGARIVEKHVTLNRAWKGTDHSFSLSPSGLHQVVRNLRRARQALGGGHKTVCESEIKPIMKMSKKVVAGRDLPENHIINFEDLAFKCPGDGLAPYRWRELEGRTLKVSVAMDEPLSLEMVD